MGLHWPHGTTFCWLLNYIKASITYQHRQPTRINEKREAPDVLKLKVNVKKLPQYLEKLPKIYLDDDLYSLWLSITTFFLMSKSILSRSLAVPR